MATNYNLHMTLPCAKRRRLLVRHALVLPVILCLLTGSRASPIYVGRSGNTIVDDLGFRWDINYLGQVERGQNNCFSGAFTLQVQGNRFKSTQMAASKEGTGYDLSGTINNIGIERRIRLDTKAGIVHYVDSFRNQSPQHLSIQARVMSNFNGQMMSFISNTGAPGIHTVDKKNSGLLCLRNPGDHRPQVLMHFGSPSAKSTMTINHQNMYELYINYNLPVPPGDMVSITYAVAQRHATPGPRAKELAAMFKPFKGTKWLRTIPSDVRKSIVNLRRGWIADRATRVSIEDMLGHPQGHQDTLIVGGKTIVRGEAVCDRFSVRARDTTVDIPFEAVAAVAGPHHTGGGAQFYLQDGQILTGKIEIEALRFGMGTGVEIALDPDTLDRLIMRRRDPPSVDHNKWFIETFNNERLGVLEGATGELTVATCWGQRTVALDEIHSLHFVTEDAVGHVFHLADGSRFYGFLRDTTLTLPTQYFGTQTFDSTEIRSLTSLGAVVTEDGQPVGHLAQVVLKGENRITARVGLDRLVFHVLDQTFPVPPDQIRRMERDDDDEAKDEFLADLWNGDIVAGSLKDPLLPIRFAGQEWRIPLEDIVAVETGSPSVPEGTRVQIASLIRQLGSPDWKQRENAAEELKTLGVLARTQLADTLTQTQDVEVRERVEELLNHLEH